MSTKRYVVKVKGLYVDNVGKGHIDLIKKLPMYGLSDNLTYARKQKQLVKSLLGLEGEIYKRTIRTEKKNITMGEVVDLDTTDGKYYIFENDKSQYVKNFEYTGDIELSFQQPYKMSKLYQVERVKERLKEYGLEGYNLKEVTDRMVIEKEDEE